MKKKTLVVISTLIFLLGFATIAFATAPIRIIADGQVVETDVVPQLVNGRVLVPIRAAAEALKANIEWDAKEKAVLITGKDNKANELQISYLQQALAPKTPVEAANSWAEGVKTRNGALQYAVMDAQLQKEFYKEFSQNNWSTGVSSPWVASYQVTQREAAGDTCKFEVKFTYTDSTNNVFWEKRLITVDKSDDSWFVSNIMNIDVAGQITDLSLKDGKTNLFVENPQPEKGSYDKAHIAILPETKIYQGYSNQELSPEDLEKGMQVEVFFNGPVLMIYPVQGGAKEIRVF